MILPSELNFLGLLIFWPVYTDVDCVQGIPKHRQLSCSCQPWQGDSAGFSYKRRCAALYGALELLEQHRADEGADSAADFKKDTTLQ